MAFSRIDKILAHYGILGMRWGIRKNKRTPSSEHLSKEEKKKKRAYELTNKEIEEFNRRVALEEQFNRINPTRAQRGKQAVFKALEGLGKQVLTKVTDQAANKIAERLVEAALKKG